MELTLAPIILKLIDELLINQEPTIEIEKLK